MNVMIFRGVDVSGIKNTIAFEQAITGYLFICVQWDVVNYINVAAAQEGEGRKTINALDC